MLAFYWARELTRPGSVLKRHLRRPNTTKKIRQYPKLDKGNYLAFLGLCNNYTDLFPSFVHLIYPMHKLSRSKFIDWTGFHDTQFDYFEQQLLRPRIILLEDPHRDVIVETDGIHTALNGVLKQNIEDTSLKHLIGCLISAIINA